MLKFIAVDGMTLVFSDPNVQGSISIVTPASVKVKAQGKGVYVDKCNISVTNITYPTTGATIPDPGPYIVEISSSAEKVKADNSFVLLEGDESATINATPQIPASPSPTPNPISFTVQIQSAGQIKVKAQ